MLQEGGITGDTRVSGKSSEPKVYNLMSRVIINAISNWCGCTKVPFLREQLILRRF